MAPSAGVNRETVCKDPRSVWNGSIHLGLVFYLRL